MASLSANTLDTLIKLANEASDAAAESMGKAKKALLEAEEKAEMLRTYRQDYIDNLTKILEKGIGKETHANYLNFLKKLDQAISGQEEWVITAQYQFETERKVWLEAQRKKMSFEVLKKRTKKKAHQVATKKDQKMMDEYASRSRRINTA